MLMGEPFSRRETPSLESQRKESNSGLHGESAEMASGGDLVQDLCEEATCPICLDYFRDPTIITQCGHNFCRACLSQTEGGRETSCPQCRRTFREGNLLPNRQLVRVVEIAKKLRFQGPKVEEGKRGVCGKHQEPLKLFCKEDEAPICVVCDRAKEHRNHQVVPAEEAAQEYQDLICIQVELLRRKREKILVDKADAEKESENLLKLTEMERQKTVAQFQEIRSFLEEQEKLLLAQMDEVEKEIARQKDEHGARLSQELTSVECLIQELEEKRQQPASELLKDVQSALQRSEEKAAVCENPVAFSVELKWKIRDFCDINPFLDGLMEQFKKTLLCGQQLEKANVSLDPDTAFPWLVLSEDCKSVRWGKKAQDRPKNSETFDTRAVVLGREEFTAGRHFWEVLVEGEGLWAVGVARKSVRRKGPVKLSPEEGIWAVGKGGDKRRTTGSPEYPIVLQRGLSTRIRVTLNYAGRRVAFFHADTGDLLYSFSATSFSGETLHPLFYLLSKTNLRISP